MNSHCSPPPYVVPDNQAYHDRETTTPLQISAQPLTSSSPLPPPIVYGELSILGCNGSLPNGERSGRRNKSKYLLCKRPQANGIKKSRHYIVKQPQATRAIQDKDLHSISYTFSRSQTIIVEYKQDETTDMFQIGRSSEDPIDFVVMDTLPPGCHSLTDNSSSHGNSGRHHSGKHHPSSAAAPSSSNNYPQHYPNHHLARSENASSSHQQMMGGDLHGINRIHRHLAKVGEELIHYGFPTNIHDSRNNRLTQLHGQSPLVLSFPTPNLPALPSLIVNQLRFQDPSMYQYLPPSHPSSSQQNQQLYRGQLSSNYPSAISNQCEHASSRQQQNGRHSNGDSSVCKRSHTTQSTISRFACRVLVDREPPYTARIYAAGFDSSKNIFLGQKATKWEQNNSIDGLTTNGILLMHPKRGFFQDTTETPRSHRGDENDPDVMDIERGDGDNGSKKSGSMNCKGLDSGSLVNDEVGSESTNRNRIDCVTNLTENSLSKSQNNDSNNNSHNHVSATSIKVSTPNFEYGGVWREVSVDGGIYAIRESRSAIQKGKRIESETNVLQDGTLIDLCGATLLWRSLDGFKASPTKKSLEEKIDLLNASRPQCPVGLNTLVIPRKPILPNSNHRSHSHQHHKKEGYGHTEDKSHQPYVYLKCGHVQGYHDWGTTEKPNQRTCPICLSVGHVAKLSMGLEPSFYVDSGPLTHVFNPCGHMASERTVKYWSSISIPHGTHFFHAICPFCATPLATNESSSTKLIFQEDSD